MMVLLISPITTYKSVWSDYQLRQFLYFRHSHLTFIFTEVYSVRDVIVTHRLVITCVCFFLHYVNSFVLHSACNLT